MGQYAGVVPRKFFRFHCSDSESIVLNNSNTESAENSSNLPRTSGLETFKETETSLANSLAVLHVATTKESTPRDSGENIVSTSSIASQESLLSSNDEGSGGLEKFFAREI